MTSDVTVDVPSVIAHRGFAGAYPENTAHAACRAGAHDHVEMVEVDVVPTADGTVVCFHDDHLHRTDRSRGITDTRGTVWETDTDTVLNAAVLESGETVPQLTSVLDALPEDVGINVELKNPGTTESTFATSLPPTERDTERRMWEPFVADVSAILERFQGPKLVSSFYEGALAAFRAKVPAVPIGVLVWDSLVDGFEVARRYDAEAIHPPWNLVHGTTFAGASGHLYQSPDVGTDVVEAAHADGRAVNVWTVDTWHRADQLTRAGVDGLIADYPCIVERPKWQSQSRVNGYTSMDRTSTDGDTDDPDASENEPG